MPVCRLVRFISFLIALCFCILLPTGCQDPEGTPSEPDPSVFISDGSSAVPDSRPDAYSLIEPETPLTVELGDGIILNFPAGWSEQTASDSVSEWANREQTVFLSAERVPLDSAKGLTGEIILNGIREEVEQSYPASDGYTVQTETVFLSAGETAALTVSGTGDRFRQQISLIRGSAVYILTVSAPTRAEAQSVWTYVNS